jgi:hypothetical protein
MAYLPDEQNQQGQNGAAGPSNGQADGTAGAAPITSSPAPSGAGASGGKTINQASSTGPAQPFTNLQTYLTANQPQIEQQGQTIAGGLTQQYGQTVGAVDQAKQDFGSAVNAGYAQNDPTVVNKFTQDPTAVANDSNLANKFTGMYNDRYTGPSSFESSSQYGAANDAVQKAQSAAQQVSTMPGLQSYLMGQNPTETQGMATLDSALLGGNPNVVKTIQDAATPFQNLPSYLTGAVTNANQSVADAQAQAQAARDATQGAFKTYSGDFNTKVGNEYTGAVNDATKFNQNYNDIIARLSGTMPAGQQGGIQQLTPDEQAALGISNDAIGQYAQANSLLDHYNTAPDSVKFGQAAINALPSAGPVSLANYLSGGHTASLPQNAGAVATPQEYAIAAALSKLGGQDYNSPLDQANAGMAGTYKPNGAYQTFDQSGANGQIDAVTLRDKAMANQLFANNAGATSGDFAGVKDGDYAGALAALQKGLASNPGGLTPSIAYEMDALNRLANGFTAPSPGYTYTPTPPSLGGGVGTPPPPPSGGGGGIVAR